MKVLSYNTFVGGFDGALRERYEAQMQLIRELAPDVLLLQEARGFEANGSAVLLETEQRPAMRGFLGPAPHTAQNTAIIVKAPVHAMSVVTDNEHFHHARLIDGDGRGSRLQRPGELHQRAPVSERGARASARGGLSRQ